MRTGGFNSGRNGSGRSGGGNNGSGGNRASGIAAVPPVPPRPPEVSSEQRPNVVGGLHSHFSFQEDIERYWKAKLVTGGVYLGTDCRNKWWKHTQDATGKANNHLVRIIGILGDVSSANACARSALDEQNRNDAAVLASGAGVGENDGEVGAAEAADTVSPVRGPIGSPVAVLATMTAGTSEPNALASKGIVSRDSIANRDMGLEARLSKDQNIGSEGSSGVNGCGELPTNHSRGETGKGLGKESCAEDGRRFGTEGVGGSMIASFSSAVAISSATAVTSVTAATATAAAGGNVVNLDNRPRHGNLLPVRNVDIQMLRQSTRWQPILGEPALRPPRTTLHVNLPLPPANALSPTAKRSSQPAPLPENGPSTTVTLNRESTISMDGGIRVPGRSREGLSPGSKHTVGVACDNADLTLPSGRIHVTAKTLGGAASGSNYACQSTSAPESTRGSKEHDISDGIETKHARDGSSSSHGSKPREASERDHHKQRRAGRGSGKFRPDGDHDQRKNRESRERQKNRNSRERRKRHDSRERHPTRHRSNSRGRSSYLSSSRDRSTSSSKSASRDRSVNGGGDRRHLSLLPSPEHKERDRQRRRQRDRDRSFERASGGKSNRKDKTEKRKSGDELRSGQGRGEIRRRDGNGRGGDGGSSVSGGKHDWRNRSADTEDDRGRRRESRSSSSSSSKAKTRERDKEKVISSTNPGTVVLIVDRAPIRSTAADGRDTGAGPVSVSGKARHRSKLDEDGGDDRRWTGCSSLPPLAPSPLSR